MDELGERGSLLGNLEDLLAYNKEKSAAENQDSLFGGLPADAGVSGLRLKPTEPAQKSEMLLWEKELLGLYISGHPLDKFKEKLDKSDTNIKRVREQLREGMTVVVAGIVEEAKELLTKKGDRMMFLKIADFTGSIETVIFPKVYEQFKPLLVLEKCLALKGKISMRNDTPGILVEKVKEL